MTTDKIIKDVLIVMAIAGAIEIARIGKQTLDQLEESK